MQKDGYSLILLHMISWERIKKISSLKQDYHSLSKRIGVLDTSSAYLLVVMVFFFRALEKEFSLEKERYQKCRSIKYPLHAT